MGRRTTWVCLVLAVALASGVYAQGVQTATLIGNATGPEGSPLPGVTVVATSPALMGERRSETGINGDYTIRGLPPGDYTVRFSLEGMQAVEVTSNLPLGLTTRVDARMALATVEETIVVSGEAPSALETTTVGTNISSDMVNKLAVTRTPTGIGSLSASVTDRTPVAGQLSISGGMAYDNSFLVNGINVQDPIFGQTNNLFIEDAIEETQVLTSGITAEYGHFTGGVLNVITKSGGNQFSGSFRASLSKPQWRDETPFEKDRGITREGDLGEIYSVTLGGPVLRDRLWFFLAGRDEENTAPAALGVTGVNVPRVISNTRYELKLTANLTSSHSLQLSYVENPVEATHEIQVAPAEIQAIGLNSKRENDGWAVGYSGVLSNALYAEARYSEKMFGFRGLGGTSTNILDSPFRSSARFPGNAGTFTYNAPYFDATDPEDRNNEQIFGALSYFLSTQSMGSHDIKAGIERYTVIRTGGNSQSSTDYVFYTGYVVQGNTPVLDSSGRLQPQWVSAANGRLSNDTRIGWWVSTRGAELDVTTDSLFINDRWDLNSNWTFNLGLRYEQVKSEATGNITSVDTDTIVPRLGVSFDPQGNGKYKFDVTYAEYSGRYNPSIIGRNSPVGSPALLYGYYVGPNGTGRNFAPGFNVNNYVFYYASVPRANIFMEDGLASPVNEEFTVSAGMSLPRGGWLKATYVNRSLTGVIDDFITLDQGCSQVIFQGINAGCFDNIVYRNTDVPKREYEAIQLQGRYQIMRNWSLEGNYTHQLKNEGNYEGEGGQSIGTSPIGNRPEIQSRREFPLGRLEQYQEHKVRLWTTYGLDLGRAGDLAASLVYRYDSARTFSYSTSVPRSTIQRNRNPGYQSITTTQTLFFGDRGIGEYNSTSLFDFALSYSIPVFKRVEPWVKFEVFNVLNDDTLILHNIGITVDNTSPLDADGLRTGFNRGSAFGQARAATDYVTPREYFVSVGIRF